MSYIGQTLPTDVFGGYTTDTFAGDGSATTFTLSQAPFNEQGLIVVINNVIQQPTTNYTVSGTTLTIVGTAVASGDVIYARHTGVALPIGEANALDMQGQSDKLILDADADTTISADTDDQIDFKIGGSDIFQMTASKLDLNGKELVIDADADTSITADTDDQIDFKVGGNDTHVFDANGHITLKQFLDATTAGGRITGASNRGDVARINLYQHAGSADGGEIRLETANSSNTMTERMRINDTGHVQITGTGASGGGANDYTLALDNQDTSSPNGIYNKYTGAAPDTGSQYFMVNQDSSTNRCIIFNTGNLGNHDNSYGAISDERIKQDITDVNSQWDDIKNLKVRNFKMKDDIRDYGDKAEKRIGLIAQETETVSPGLIQLANPSSGDIKSDASFGTLYTSDDEETKGDNPTAKVGEVKEIKEQVKHIKYSILYMKAIKALQEAMAKIETLEADVKTLKGE